jgi:hypothetical protein
MKPASIMLTCLIAVSAPYQLLHAADAPVRSPAGPAQAVLPFIRALRSNDAVALWELCASTTTTAALAGSADLPGPGGSIRERIDDALASVLAADAQDDLVARWVRWSRAGLGTALTASAATLPQLPPLPPPGDLPPPGPGGPQGGPGAPDWSALAGRGVAGLLAQGLETQQIEASKRLLAAGQSWAATIAVADADHARIAVAALIAAVKDLGATTVAEVARMEQGELLMRGGHALAHLKEVTRAYSLDLDAVLDSLRIISVMDIQPEVGAKAVTIAFSAFGSEQRFPLKVQRTASGAWTVIADSQLGALLGSRTGAIDILLAMLAPPPGFPPGGPEGRSDRRDAAPGFAPPPPGNDGF